MRDESVQEKKGKKKPKKLVQGDDAIESFEADWFDFRTPAIELAKQLYMISKSSGVCCGIIGPWGSGKSSFMKLMEEYVRKESSWKNIHIVWFTAWDPGGIQDLGDAMLFNFFRDVVGKNKKMDSTFNQLKEALGVRRSLRKRASRVLESVSGVLPTPGRTVATVAGGLLGELDASRNVQECFEKLMVWLEKENRTVFLFVDDIDRANEKQIFELLAELKLYISHRRIIAVLGYDEDYVLGALKPVLPSGIDPKKYLEKIVTIRRNLPIPFRLDLRIYAKNLLGSMLKLKENTIGSLSYWIEQLSCDNPRRLKNLVLAFTQYVSPLKHKNLTSEELVSFLVVSAAANMGLLADGEIRNKFDSGREEEIISILQEFSKKNPSKSKEVEVLIAAIQGFRPNFVRHSVARLGLHPTTRFDTEPRVRPERRKKFDWSFSFFPIFSSAAMRGFKFPSEAIESSSEIVIPPSTKIERIGSLFAKLGKYPALVSYIRRMYDHERTRVLSWNKGYMFVLFSSSFVRPVPLERNITRWFSECANLVTEKDFIMWLIDDLGVFTEEDLKALVYRAQQMSKGLKYPFIFQFTLSSKIESLVTFLLSCAGKD